MKGERKMIEVGTKLKSIRTGEVVEVLKRESGSMKVRLANGTEKVLSDSTVARWYDEVKETAAVAAPKKAVKSSKKVVTQKAETETPKVEKAKKQKAEHVLGAEMASTLNAHLEKAEYTLLEKKEYTAIVNKEEKHLAHVWVQKSKIKFSFKGTTLSEDDKKWMVQLPKHHRRSYNFQVFVTDPTLLKRVLALLDKLNGKNKGE